MFTHQIWLVCVQLYGWPRCVAIAGGCNIPGEDENWDFGTGAGFYVNASEEPWKTNYRMYAYVTEEVRQISGWAV